MARLAKLSPRTITRFKTAVLGRDFDLSVAYVTPVKMRALNRAERGIDSATDILSFRLSKTSGEILVCMPEVSSHARGWGMTGARYLPYLFIHGLIHVKGHEHGRIMTALEREYCDLLSAEHPHPVTTHGKQDSSGHRRRHVPSTRRRVASRRQRPRLS